MQTPWGDLSVSDAHLHFFSPAFFQSLANQSGLELPQIRSLLKWHLPRSNQELAGGWKQQLDSHGIAKAALIASVPGDEASVAEAVVLYPEHFYGYFMVNPLAPDAAERTVAALAGPMQGICLFPAMHRYSMADARVRPLLQAAAAAPGAIVFVHCGVLTLGVRGKLGLPSHFDMRYSNPIDLHAIALEFAQVNFVVPHFGAGYFREALMLCDLCPNVYLDTSSSNSWTRYQPESLDLKTVFRRALDVAGPRRLLFGSDSSFFPRGWNAAILQSQIEALQSLAVSAEDARLVFGGNLDRLLNGAAAASSPPDPTPLAR